MLKCSAEICDTYRLEEKPAKAIKFTHYHHWHCSPSIADSGFPIATVASRASGAWQFTRQRESVPLPPPWFWWSLYWLAIRDNWMNWMGEEVRCPGSYCLPKSSFSFFYINLMIDGNYLGQSRYPGGNSRGNQDISGMELGEMRCLFWKVAVHLKDSSWKNLARLQRSSDYFEWMLTREEFGHISHLWAICMGLVLDNPYFSQLCWKRWHFKK